MSNITNQPTELADRFDTTFEEKILQLCLRNRQFAAKYLDVLKEKHFQNLYYKALFAGFQDYYIKYKKLPSKYELQVYALATYPSNPKMVEELNSVLERLHTEEVPPVEYFDDLLLEFVKNVELSILLWGTVNNYERVDISDFTSKVSAISGLQHKTADLGISSDDFVSRLAIKDEESLGIQTTYRNFNSIVRGGMRPGELGIFMAPTNRGKTHTLVNFGRSFLTMGAGVVHYSLEMPEEDVMDRYIASMTHTSIRDLSSPAFFNKVVGVLNNYNVYTEKKLQIKFFAAKTASVRDISCHLDLMIESGRRPDLIIIDYVDLLKPSRDRRDKRFELGELYEEVRALGMAYQMPIITASQTNRQGELNDYDYKTKTNNSTNALNIAHIAEDWSKAATADYIWGIRRPMQHPIANSTPSNDSRLVILDTLKSRHSARDTRMGFIMEFGSCYMEDISIDGIDLKEGIEDAV
jgi:replicative DNA helicase